MKVDILISHLTVDRVVLLALALLIVTHFPAMFESQGIRQQIESDVVVASSAKALVESNVLKGVDFDTAWEPMVLANRASVEIAASTGIITLTFAYVGIAGKNLKFVPLVRSDQGLLPLAHAIDVKGRTSSIGIVWVCTSTYTRSHISHVMANIGTLDSKFAPETCRYEASRENRL